MPYLREPHRRADLAAGGQPQDGAELNFVISTLVDRFIQEHGLSYHTLEEIDGALGLAQFEFRRRIVGRYEDEKLAANDEVYTYTGPLLEQMFDERFTFRWGPPVAGGTGSAAAEVASGL